MKHPFSAISVILLSVLLAAFFGCSQVNAKESNKPAECVANIVLFAHFQGEQAASDKDYFAAKETRDKILDIYQGDYGRSFKQYMSRISYGQLEVKNSFPQDNGISIDSYELSIPLSQANAGGSDALIINELINNIPAVEGQIVDCDNDGYIDNLTIILKGKAPSESSTSSSLYPHKANYAGSETYYGKRIGPYNILNTYQLAEAAVSEEGGLVAHEFLHSLGYPDLYESGDLKNYPVYTWDIMAHASPYQAYPLAYLRMQISGWLDIDTIDTSQNGLTLHLQDNAKGNQAFILKSPLDEKEFFVVEFRKKSGKPTYLDRDALDTKIGGSGLIVYRINTKVEKLSNHFGETGVYVFRPQKGQSGYNEDERLNVQQAFLSQESGRTSIGSSDLSKGLTDGALTYSNGSNSGIVISSISSSQGDTMTFDVSIPEASETDLWEDTGFSDTMPYSGNKDAVLTSAGARQYLVTYSDGIFRSYQYDGTSWTQFADSFSESGYVSDMKLVSFHKRLYFAYITSGQKLVLKSCDFASNAWKTEGRKSIAAVIRL